MIRGLNADQRGAMGFFDFSDGHSTRSDRVMSALILVGIGVIAYTDNVIVANLSLGYLYLLPLVLSASVHRLRTTFALALLCAILRELLGPFSRETGQVVIRTLVTYGAFSVVIALVYRLGEARRKLSDTVRRQRDQLTRELQLAADVQRRMIPAQLPTQPGVDIAASMLSASILGGDLYDCFKLQDGRLALVVGDVSGKGAPAALLMPAILGTLRMVAQRVASCSDVMRQLNETVYGVTDESRYVSLFYAIVGTDPNRLEYCSGGHHPPLLVRAQGGDVTLLETGGPVVGLLPHVGFETGTVEFSAGDCLVLYTDGLIEAENAAGEHYGRERLEALLVGPDLGTAESVLESIQRSIREFVGEQPLRDDMTIMVCKF